MPHSFAAPDALDAFALEKMVATRLPSLVMVLIEDGEVVHRRGLGFADLTRRTPPGPDTLIGIGSITKLFTALAVMQLREQGTLDLDDPVSTHLGSDLRAHGEPVRIRHLLSHSSGIPALGFSESKMSRRWSTAGYPVSSAADMLTFMTGSDAWDQAAPGERWAYLNEGYVLLGAIIEAASGGDYRSYIRQALLEPLGMDRSHFDRATVERDGDLVTPYMLDRDNRLFVGSNLYSEIPAAGGLVSTAEDLAKVALMLLAGGRAATGAQVIETASLDTMRRPEVALPAVETSLFPAPEGGRSEELFGLGLYLQQNFLGVDVIGHGGGVMGSTGYLGVIPERGLGVVLQTNGHGYPMRQLALAALAHGLGADFEQLPFVRLDRLLARLEGSYTAFRNTMEAEVRRRGDNLELAIWTFNEDRTVWLIPEAIEEGRARFSSFSSGRRSPVEFVFSARGIDLLHERYAFRKIG